MRSIGGNTSPHAFTALLAQRHEGQVHWRTWHAYPQDGQLVATRTRVGIRVPGGHDSPSVNGTPQRTAT